MTEAFTFSPVPYGATARRLTWPHLPRGVRARVEQRCGSAVVDAVSQGAGYTPGFASVLTCADGSRHFVKAAAVKAQRAFAEAYRVEARNLAALPAGVPAPALRWFEEVEDWVVLGIEHVEARTAARPWDPAELEAALDAAELTAGLLTPAPPAMGLSSFVAEFADWPAAWARVPSYDGLADLDHVLPHVDEAAALAARYAEVCGGTTLVHTDLRDDNVLVLADGTARLVDWNWPVVGAAWLDTVLLLIGPYGDGLDADAVLARRALTRDVPAEAVDIVLALVAGYFLTIRHAPVPPTSPWLRQHQAWFAEAAWSWLAARRGWS